MDPEFDRLQQALAPRIALERRLGSGGMGTVWLGREVGPDRLVAIKTLRPDRYTADAAHRFAEEARNAARLFHPNIVRIHYNCLDGAPDPYFVMQYMEGETLRARLDRGPLGYDGVVRLGHELLDALASAHRAGIIHRDVKPANIFLEDGRAVLGDFGISKAIDRSSDRDATGGALGTPDYMAPEQFVGEASYRSDLWAVGVVLWEACTGRRWERVDPSAADWSRVPAPLRDPLAGALQWNQAERWSDAAAFAGALPAPAEPSGDTTQPTAGPERPPQAPSPRSGRGRWLAVAGGSTAAAIAWAIWRWLLPPVPTPLTATPVGVVVAPFDQAASMPAVRGYEIAGRTSFYLRRLPHVASTPIDLAAHAWRSADPQLSETERLRWLAATMHARYSVSGRVQGSGPMLEIRLRAYDTLTHRLIELPLPPADSSDLAGLGDRIGLEIAQRLLHSSDPPTTALRFTHNADAAAEFWEGEEATSRGAWKTAEDHYVRALKADSTLVIAKWRLGMARRWSLNSETFPRGFYPLDSIAREGLSPTEAMLVDAQFARSAAQRFALYRRALESAPSDPYVALLYGDELFHRGPLAGKPLDSAVAMLARAASDQPFMAPAWEHLAWARIRLGQRDSAALALRWLGEVSGPPTESWIYLPALLRFAFAIRFDAPPAQAAAALLDSAHALPRAARGAIGFDLPQYQLTFGEYLENAPGTRTGVRGNALVAQGVALIALGRPTEAFARFDSAAAAFPAPEEAALQAAEWRVLPAALGLPGVAAGDRAAGRARLESLAADTGVRGRRAAWALAVDGFLRNDTTAALRWRAEAARVGDPRMEPLDRMLDALQTYARGDSNAVARTSALAMTSPVLDADSAGHQIDPFLRATAHLTRGTWAEAAGAFELTDRAWLWYENTDVVGWPSAEAQPVDVDWALGAFAGAKRARLAFRQGDRIHGCALARRTLAFWSRPEPSLTPVVDSLRALARECPP